MITLKLKLQYYTSDGETLWVTILHAGGETSQHAMDTADGHIWTATINVEQGKARRVEYYYTVRKQDTEVRREWQMMTHCIHTMGMTQGTLLADDLWRDIPENSYLYSSAFTECIHRRTTEVPGNTISGHVLYLKVRTPQLRSGERLMLVGDIPLLGAWNPQKGLLMHEYDCNEWSAVINTEGMEGQEIEYKLIIAKTKDETDVKWEEGENRHLRIPVVAENEIIVSELSQAIFAVYDERYAGTAVPVFSLRSEGSFGVGDFGDLCLMIDWVSKTRQRLLQILPINDTTSTHTWTDSYPYSCISIFALHPQYCDLRQLPPLKDKARAAEFETLRQQLNVLPQIDYERVNNAKAEYLHLLFEQDGKGVLASREFKAWFAEEQYWLVPYAQFCVMRDRYGTAHYTEWPDHNVWDETDRKALTSSRTKAYGEVSFFYYVQFVLAQQMKAAHEHARRNNVVLKGDIPIGVNRYGCDAWMEPRYFNMSGQAGAPPDDFSTEGQNWGFPTYNWDEMLRDGCQWWVRRFTNMAKYFDAYRIDHVLGFFRIWEVPMPYSIGLMGQFQPALGLTPAEVESYGLHWDENRLVKPCSEYDWDCLFLRDHNDPNKFHPRIASQLSQVYNILEPWEKECYNRLYDDYFYRRNDHFWYGEAMKKLPLLVNATRMLVCAEDLGMVPDCVASVMNELRILSLEIQSMPKETGLRFGKLHHNPYRSVCTISSHDTATLRMWWDEDYERTQDYYNNRLRRGGDAPHPLPGWLARDIVSRHLLCPSMLCILTLQDWLATDESLRLDDANAERINIPANPKHYWRYRMHLTLEQLLASERFNGDIAELISKSGRR